MNVILELQQIVSWFIASGVITGTIFVIINQILWYVEKSTR